MADVFDFTTRSRIMRSIKGSGNLSTEVAFRMAMVRAGLRGWVLQPREVLGRPDFAFLETKIAIFVDGCFWHGCARRGCRKPPKTNVSYWLAKIRRNRARDRSVNKRLRDEGWIPLRIAEHELRDGEAWRIVRLVAANVSVMLQLQTRETHGT